jgi:hypothetical protein
MQGSGQRCYVHLRHHSQNATQKAASSHHSPKALAAPADAGSAAPLPVRPRPKTELRATRAEAAAPPVAPAEAGAAPLRGRVGGRFDDVMLNEMISPNSVQQRSGGRQEGWREGGTMAGGVCSMTKNVLHSWQGP